MTNAFRRLLLNHRRWRHLPSPHLCRRPDSSDCSLIRPSDGLRIGSSRPFLLIRQFSTGFTSVHGERPSAEYAKRRKESLETEFGHILGAHRSESWFSYHRFGPFLALYRAAIISFYLAKLTVWHFFVRDIRKRAVKFREALINLGPFYIKLGQALSTRSDILPSSYCQELSKLQDQIPPYSTIDAIKSIESQLGLPINQTFADISPKPIAAASLGQVYKAHLHSGELVAVKVQRPGMSFFLTLDALLFHMIGGQLKRFAKARKDLLVAVNEMVRHMFDEIDYILEAQNAERFASLYASKLLALFIQLQLMMTANSYDNPRTESIKVPKIYWNFTRKALLTMEWIDGIKLTDAHRINKANLNRKQLIDQGLYCSLRQLLEEGYFHADPHPGNLVVTESGSLAYFDFGMMGEIPRHFRVGLIQVLVHYVNRDSSGLANDFLSLGFIPDGTDIQSVADALHESFGEEGSRHSNDFQGIMDQLYDIMYEFDFSLPPDYALVIRALGSLEGTAKALDPSFKVVESAYPYVIGRLLADPNPDMRRILRELLIRSNGSIRWNRLERLIAAISEQSSDTENEATLLRKGFDMHSVVASTEDLFNFVLSEKGWRVRVFLVQDILKAADTFINEAGLPCMFDNQKTMESSALEKDTLATRLVDGFCSLRRAISLAPEAWGAMFLRTLAKSNTRRFLLDIFSSLAVHFGDKIPETFFLCISKFIHWLEKEDCCQRDS
ncbi:hypothetical protein ZIOFF_068587 [Zingiber officinale]|uniref:Protein kinase domain-containing protein n=1 Tax=Zingiber officinale TaxID=94328 RepID=A0A8J5EER6_ZINOF|nr:hypothetical protein ZIOFF_068587 [Zingiber officinale]